MTAAGNSVFDFTVPDLDSNDFPLEKLRGNVLLIVNTASKGYHKKMLKRLYQLHQIFYGRPLCVLAFPCAQFLGQEKSSNMKIKRYYIDEKQYTFNVFSKIKVVGSDAHPLFKWLRKSSKSTGSKGKIHWNFNKFLVEVDGMTVKHYGVSFSWSHLAIDINDALKRAEQEKGLPVGTEPNASQLTLLDRESEQEGRVIDSPLKVDSDKDSGSDEDEEEHPKDGQGAPNDMVIELID